MIKNGTGRLVLDSKPNEVFVLYDELSKTQTKIDVFYRNSGNLALAFMAPQTVRISRQKQGTAENGNE